MKERIPDRYESLALEEFRALRANALDEL